MTRKTLFRSFAGGEITPELAGRVDLTKFQTGLALCENMITLPHGPAVRRPGFEFVAEARFSAFPTRLIPFIFSNDQSVVLEFGHQYIRFHIDGAPVVEDAVAIASIVGNAVTTTAPHNYALGDWVYIGGQAHLINVTGADTFTTSDLWGAQTAPSGATSQRVYTLATTFNYSDLFDITFAQDSDVVTLTHVGGPAQRLSRLDDTNWTLEDIDFSPSAEIPGTPNVVVTNPTAGNPEPQAYCVTSVSADGVTESLASGVTEVSNDLSIAGNYNTLDWTVVASSSRYNVYKRKGGIFGFIGYTSTGNTLVDNNIDPDTTQSPPEDIIGLNAGPLDYPATSAFHEQRSWFAGPTAKPQVVFATRTGTQTNLTNSVPLRDTDGMEFRLAATQNNQVRHLVPLSDLLALTGGGVFRIFSEGAPAITATSFSVKSQGNAGASRVQPVVTPNSVLYVQTHGSRVRELAYSWESNTYRSTDISVMAPHRFRGRTITQLAFQQTPDPTLWAVRDDGVLLALTYMPEQQVGGWHVHTTFGAFESCCVVPENGEDVLYVVVRRLVKGRAVRYIERMRSQLFDSLADAFFVDSGLAFDAGAGNTVTQVSGLHHLDTATVSILADGAVLPAQVVTNGTITLTEPARKVTVGVKMVSRMKTLPLVAELQASGQGTMKNINEVHLRVKDSSLVKAGPDFDHLTEVPARDVEDLMGSPPGLHTGVDRLAILPAWTEDGEVCIEQDNPVPLTIVSVVTEYQTGG